MVNITLNPCGRQPSRAWAAHPGPVARTEYYHDDTAPPPNSMTPTAFAAVRDDHGRLLLVRRSDSGNWELPGGRVELGLAARQRVLLQVRAAR
jgi:8-oxo-dGTP pyrophosphatase MutT (NUDIX family)